MRQPDPTHRTPHNSRETPFGSVICRPSLSLDPPPNRLARRPGRRRLDDPRIRGHPRQVITRCTRHSGAHPFPSRSFAVCAFEGGAAGGRARGGSARRGDIWALACESGVAVTIRATTVMDGIRRCCSVCEKDSTRRPRIVALSSASAPGAGASGLRGCFRLRRSASCSETPGALSLAADTGSRAPAVRSAAQISAQEPPSRLAPAAPAARTPSAAPAALRGIPATTSQVVLVTAPNASSTTLTIEAWQRAGRPPTTPTRRARRADARSTKRRGKTWVGPVPSTTTRW
jgi:hypothetical protein